MTDEEKILLLGFVERLKCTALFLEMGVAHNIPYMMVIGYLTRIATHMKSELDKIKAENQKKWEQTNDKT